MPPCRPSRSYLCLQDVQRHIKARHRKTLRQPVIKKKRCGSAARIPGTRTNSTPVTGGDAASHKTQNCFGSKIQMLHFWISVLFPQISGSSFGSPTKQTGQNPVVLLIRSTMRPDAPETLWVWKGKFWLVEVTDTRVECSSSGERKSLQLWWDISGVEASLLVNSFS